MSMNDILFEASMHVKVMEAYIDILQELNTATIARPELIGMPSWQTKRDIALEGAERHKSIAKELIATAEKMKRAK
jgi:hypothetical protein